MPYQLQDPTRVAEEIRRIAHEQIDKILKQLMDTDASNQDQAIHNARKSLKKLRALLRLVRPQIGSKQYHQENGCFREAGHSLSAMRDAQVRLETLDTLTAHFSEQLEDDSFAAIQAVLTADYQAAEQQILQEGDAIVNAVARVKAAEERVQDWQLDASNWLMVSKGLTKVYQQGSQRFAKATKQPSVERLHDWRKRAKDLWYHLRLLKPIWPDLMQELTHQLKLLSNYLGDDHDLAVLRQTLLAAPERFAGDSEVEMLVALIDRRRSELQTAAQRLGERLYAEDPSDFVDRIETYWQVWQTEVAQPMLVNV